MYQLQQGMFCSCGMLCISCGRACLVTVECFVSVAAGHVFVAVECNVLVAASHVLVAVECYVSVAAGHV